MAQEQYNSSNVITLPASGDHSSNQFKFVEVDTNGRASLVDNAGDHPIGILQNDPDAIDTDAEIMGTPPGVSKLLVNANSANIVVGDKCGPDANGLGVKKTSGEYHCIALEAATEDAVLIGVVWTGTREV